MLHFGQLQSDPQAAAHGLHLLAALHPLQGPTICSSLWPFLGLHQRLLRPRITSAHALKEIAQAKVLTGQPLTAEEEDAIVWSGLHG